MKIPNRMCINGTLVAIVISIGVGFGLLARYLRLATSGSFNIVIHTLSFS